MLVRKLINNKIENFEYFKTHMLNLIFHITGNHEKCDEFYCTQDHKFEKIEI